MPEFGVGEESRRSYAPRGEVEPKFLVALRFSRDIDSLIAIEAMAE